MIRKRSITIRGHRTSVSLEEEFWNSLRDIAERGDTTIGGLMTDIDAARQPDENLSSAARLHVLRWYRERCRD